MGSIRYAMGSKVMLKSQSVSAPSLGGGAEEFAKAFWLQWDQYRDDLYRCCIKWMGGNSTDAEDALSRAMLKAWEKVQKHTGEIANFKAWLTKLTHNLCVDIYREHSRGAKRVENIEAIPEELGLVTFDDTPESAMETAEKRIVIRRAIDNLPTRLRETFILHFYEELSYAEIAQQQDISYQNVCKRISQARSILVEELRGYFIGEYETKPDKSVALSSITTESATGEMSSEKAQSQPIAIETGTFFGAVEEVETVVGESPPQEELVMFVATADEILEVKIDSFRLEIETVFPKLLSAATLALNRFDEEVGSWWQSLRLRSLILPAVGIHKFLYSQLPEMQLLFQQRWRVWMDAGGCRLD